MANSILDFSKRSLNYQNFSGLPRFANGLSK